MGLLVALITLFPILINAQIPTITGIQGLTGALTGSLLTAGGEQLVLLGTNFGAANAQLTYTGPSPFTNGLLIKYTPPIQSQTNTQITFTTVPGIGANLQFEVVTQSKSSITSIPIASYALPKIMNITIPTGTTAYSTKTLRPQGGDRIIINAKNLGPRTYPGYPTTYTPTIRFGTTTGTYGWLYSCTRQPSNFDNQISCLVPVGGGTNHTVRIQAGVTGQWSNIDLSILISYVTPTVVSASSTIGFMNTAGGEQIVIRGLNMPYPSWVIAGYCPIKATFGPYLSTYFPGYDHSGGDFPGMPVKTSSQQGCAALCQTTQGCLAWAFSIPSCAQPNNCWLKQQIPTPQLNACRYSGVLPSPPLSPYKMVSCTGAFDTDGKTPVITCQTPPGTGTGYAFSLNVANIYTNILNNIKIGYGQPVIYNYGGPYQAANTLGNEVILINGNNFGNNSALITATYELDLKQPTHSIANFTYISPACTVISPNTQLGCKTAPGVGSDLTWSVTVDSQRNINPNTAYAPPQITTLQVVNKTSLQPKPSADTNGQDLLYIQGFGYGYPLLNLIQSIYMQSPEGTQIPLYNYSLISDSLITVPIPPGGGSGWQLWLSIADIQNIPSPANFSYTSPVITNVSPQQGPTLGNTLITLTIENIYLETQSFVTAVAFGNPSDNTLYPTYLPTLRVNQPDIVNTSAKSSPQFVPNTLTFFTPPGYGLNRQIRLVTYSAQDLPPDITQLNQLQKPILYNYSDPLIKAIILSSPQTPTQIQNSINFFSIPSANVLTIFGTNFAEGSQATTIQVYNVSQSVWLIPTTDFMYLSTDWTDSQITLYTLQSSGSIRILISSLDPQGIQYTQLSNVFSFNNLSPLIISNSTTAYPTTGNSPVQVQIMYLASAQNINVTVNSQPCPILDPQTNLPLQMADIYAKILTNPQVYSPPGPFTSATVWSFSCLLPSGQGSQNPLVVQRYPDNAVSNPMQIAYQAPQIILVNGNPFNPYLRLLSPTEGSQLTLTGTNFGPCPTLIVATYTINTCIDVPNSINNEQTLLTIQLPPGEGTGQAIDSILYPNGWQIILSAADQQATPILFGYNSPTLTSITSTDYPTTGQIPLTITGTNFGQSLPNYPQSALSPLLQLFINMSTPLISNLFCQNPIRLSHTQILCTLPPGAGKIDTFVSVAGQQSISPFPIQYNKPTILSVLSNATKTIINNTAVLQTNNATNPIQLVIVGTDFGPNELFSCVFLSSRKTINRDPSCNGQEDYAGEGELPNSQILFWNHTLITIIVPPGSGTPLLSVVAYFQINQLNPSPFFQYSPPFINTLSLFHGPANGNYPVSLLGSGFGYSSSSVQTYPIPLPISPSQIFYEPITLYINNLCLTQLPDSLCQPLIISYIDNQLTFTMVEGIGANITFQVKINDPITTISSNIISLWSYDPPQITDFNPNPVYVGPSPTVNVILQGANFGSLRAFQLFPTADQNIYLYINGLNQQNPQRIQQDGKDRGIQFPLNANIVAGPKSVSLTVASQKNTMLNTSFNALQIFCQPNYFAKAGEFCIACPTGATCAGNLDYPISTYGFYNLNSSYQSAVQCPQSNVITNPDNTVRDLCILPCSPAAACLQNNVCSQGYISTQPTYRCNTCDNGFYRLSNSCIKCPDSPIMLIIGCLLIIIALSFTGYFLNKYKVNLAFISIAVDYFQVVSILLDSRIRWPQSIVQLMQVLSAFNLNLNIVAPECLLPNISFLQKFYFIQALPISLFVVLLLINFCQTAYKAIILGRKKKDLLRHVPTYKSAALIVFYFLYLYLTRTILDIFDCSPTIPPSYDSNGNTIKYLAVVFEQCGKPGGLQQTLLPLASVALIVYSLGFPAILAYALYKNREEIMLDQLLRAKNSGDTRLTNPTAYDIRKAYSRIYYQFKPNYFWWSMTVLARKFLIATTAVMFSSDVAFQMAACLLILFLAYVLQTRFNPFMSYNDYELVILQNETASKWSSLNAKLHATIKDIEFHGRKRARSNNILAKDGQINKQAVFRATADWIFNYNTVEAVMLFCGVIVSLLGLMYESQSAQQSQSARDAIAGLVIFIIASSVIYLASVFSVEVYISINSTKKLNNLLLSNRNLKVTLEMVPQIGRQQDQIDTAEMNPLMLNIDLTSSLDVDKFSEPPTKEVWALFKTLIKKQTTTITSQNTIIAELKKQTQQDAIVIGATESKNQSLRIYRKEFSAKPLNPINDQ